ncbi:MAG: hypothetical protein Q7T18_04660, partial [Sedimentisphaerales bacterium]|nr:hypothetical protein [Sedimentisphaerales bacterium]
GRRKRPLAGTIRAGAAVIKNSKNATGFFNTCREAGWFVLVQQKIKSVLLGECFNISQKAGRLRAGCAKNQKLK